MTDDGWMGGASRRVEELDGRVSVHVVAHTLQTRIGTYAAWTWHTEGLNAHDAPELVFTALRSNTAQEDHPAGPRMMLKALVERALRRDWGAWNLVPLPPEARPFGAAFEGVTFVPVIRMTGVRTPDYALTVIALKADEFEVAQTFGAMRVLSRMAHQTGSASRSFRTPTRSG